MGFAEESGCRCECEPVGCCRRRERRSTADLYDAEERPGLSEGVVSASLGCGSPAALAELPKGEVVLGPGWEEGSILSSLRGASTRAGSSTAST
jgi:hypothetical protein